MSRSETTPPNNVGRLSSLAAIRELTAAVELTDWYLAPASNRRAGEGRTLAFGHHEDRTPTHGYEATREAPNGCLRQELE
jgi:hypothetical protein